MRLIAKKRGIRFDLIDVIRLVNLQYLHFISSLSLRRYSLSDFFNFIFN
jgi:hypothetical protein